MESAAFTFVCEEIEQKTSLNRIEARGTVRLALKEAGLDAGAVKPAEMVTVVKRLLPREFAARGLRETDSLLAELCVGLARISAVSAESGAAPGPEQIFSRLGGRG